MVGSSIPQSQPGSAARGEVGREEMYEAVWGGRLPLTDYYGRRKKYSPAAAPALAHVSCSGYPPEIRKNIIHSLDLQKMLPPCLH